MRKLLICAAIALLALAATSCKSGKGANPGITSQFHDTTVTAGSIVVLRVIGTTSTGLITNYRWSADTSLKKPSISIMSDSCIDSLVYTVRARAQIVKLADSTCSDTFFVQVANSDGNWSGPDTIVVNTIIGKPVASFLQDTIIAINDSLQRVDISPMIGEPYGTVVKNVWRIVPPSKVAFDTTTDATTLYDRKFNTSGIWKVYVKSNGNDGSWTQSDSTKWADSVVYHVMDSSEIIPIFRTPIEDDTLVAGSIFEI